MLLYKNIARKIPGLALKLEQARLPYTPEQYVRRTFMSSLFLSVGLLIIFFTFLKSIGVIFFVPIVFFIAFMYFLRYADVKIDKINMQIDQELVFAGRFLIIELESGVPLYQVFKNLAKNYDIVGPYFNEVVQKVDLGTPLEDALNEMITTTSSTNFRKILWQILNSMRTGANVANSLNTVISQVIRQQQIAVKEYGRKLNPLAMFYMMIAVIVPSLGTAFMVVMSLFIGIKISLTVLLLFAGFLGFVQFMFLSIIKSSRPPMEM